VGHGEGGWESNFEESERENETRSELTTEHLLNLNPNPLSTDPLPQGLLDILVLDCLDDVLVEVEAVTGGESNATDDSERVVVEGRAGRERCSNDSFL